jgi:hypothetical protein
MSANDPKRTLRSQTPWRGVGHEASNPYFGKQRTPRVPQANSAFFPHRHKILTQQ